MLFDKEYDLQGVVDRIMNRNQNTVQELFLLEHAKHFPDDVPEEWMHLHGKSKEETIDYLWGGPDGHFPRYSAYLKEHLVGLFLGKYKWGPLMAYFLKDLDLNYGWGTEMYRLDGVLFAGAPAPALKISEFIEQHGPIAPAVEALWKTHGWMQLRNRSIMVGPGQFYFFRYQADPKVIGPRRLEEEPSREHDCLAFINPWSELSHCLTRPNGQEPWGEPIMEAELNGSHCFGYSEVGLDALLARPW